MMDTTKGGPDVWVDVANGLVSREPFVSEEIFQLEQERIFSRVWLYLAHDSEISSPGDFVTRSLAGAPVIVIRAPDGSVKVLLNSCRHRGSKICRAESGNAKGFVCPYHGWSFDGEGRFLRSAFKQLYPEGTDFSQWGLVAVPRVESYKGLVFGSWNDGVESLADYLGDYRWYLDLFFARTARGTEVLAPPQRFRVKTNWKIAAINFGTDNQHVYTTHVGPFALQKGPIPRAAMIDAVGDATLVWTAKGHTVSMISHEAARPYVGFLPEMVPLYRETLTPAQQSLVSGAITTVGNVFPNLSFLERYLVTETPQSGTTLALRIWQPVSAGEIEIVSWALAEKETSLEFKNRSLNDSIRNFGVAGLFEQEDVELWAGIIDSSSNAVARAYPFNFQTALPSLYRPLEGWGNPGEAYKPSAAETTQFKFLQHWNRLMGGAQ
jgi:phenylpropionate dioxygenase-like ring-hydroxylating dioxygenase large terminal subunit